MKESEKCREFTHFNRSQLLPSEHENDENKRRKKVNRRCNKLSAIKDLADLWEWMRGLCRFSA